MEAQLDYANSSSQWWNQVPDTGLQFQSSITESSKVKKLNKRMLKKWLSHWGRQLGWEWGSCSLLALCLLPQWAPSAAWHPTWLLRKVLALVVNSRALEHSTANISRPSPGRISPGRRRRVVSRNRADSWPWAFSSLPQENYRWRVCLPSLQNRRAHGLGSLEVFL